MFDVYMTAKGATEKGDKQKACIFLHVVGEEAVQDSIRHSEGIDFYVYFLVSHQLPRYHRTIHMIYEHIPGCTTMMYDIMLWDSTLHEHNQRLQQVFDASRKSNLKLNREKCVFGVKELTFVGDNISAERIKPDETKVKAITNVETPNSKKDEQRFLGMFYYQARYFPDLSSKTQVLRNLTEEKKLISVDCS